MNGSAIESQSLSELVSAANAKLTDPKRNRLVNPDGSPLRFELYHGPGSVCSQKVRTTLMEVGVPFFAHDMKLDPNTFIENYDPDYVLLRLKGRAGRAFIDKFTGGSATSTEGFDALVVPTLIDHQAASVVVDSANICKYISEAYRDRNDLLPAQHRAAIEKQMDIVDQTPHVALLYGEHPGEDRRPVQVQNQMATIYQKKIALLKLSASEAAKRGIPELDQAYERKLRRELVAQEFVRQKDEMAAALSETASILSQLEGELPVAGDWICGDTYSLADICWTISLFRLKWLGVSDLWEGGAGEYDRDLPRVRAYAGKLFSRRSFQRAVLGWPGVPMTPPVANMSLKTEA